MNKEQLEKSHRHFEFAGAIVCSLSFGYVLWVINLPSFSLEPLTLSERLSVIPYWLLTAGCYLGAFWLLDRYFSVPQSHVRINWAAISLFGTTFSFIAARIPTLWGNEFDGEVLLAMLFMLCSFNILMFIVMASIWSTGFILRYIRKASEESRVVPD